jgi:hypothetical protein
MAHFTHPIGVLLNRSQIGLFDGTMDYICGATLVDKNKVVTSGQV